MVTNLPPPLKPYSRFSNEVFLSKLLRTLLSKAHRLLRGAANNLLDERVIRPREFSNAILKYYAPIFTGDVINVSGWKDGDFESSTYRNYFTSAHTYRVSNAPTSSKGLGSLGGEIEIDLSKPLDPKHVGSCDVVFNHTTLEHIFEIDQAFANLCAMSREAVILVVPTLQHIHFNEGYGDYHRLTPMAVVRYFEKNGFETLVLRSNEQQFSPVYCFAIAVKKGSKYLDRIEKDLDFSMGGELYGSKLKDTHLKKHVHT